MELVVSIIALILLLSLAIMFYERSRRGEAAREQLLRERIQGTFVATRSITTTAPSALRVERPRSELTRRMERWLAQAGIEMPLFQFVILVAMIWVAGTLLSALWVSAGIALIYGIGFAAAPLVYGVVQRRRRLRTFGQQLPYVLDFVRSALRAGHTLLRAFKMSSENAPEPIATEIKLALEQMRFGASLPDALDSMLKRVPEESLEFFVAAVRVQSTIGSGVAEVLDRVCDAIRDRQRLQQQLQTLTAQ